MVLKSFKRFLNNGTKRLIGSKGFFLQGSKRFLHQGSKRCLNQGSKKYLIKLVQGISFSHAINKLMGEYNQYQIEKLKEFTK